MAYADTVTLSCLGPRSPSEVRCPLEKPSFPYFAWFLFGNKVLDFSRAEGHGTEVDMGLGRDKRNGGGNSRLALYHWSPHQHARGWESSFPTSLGSWTFQKSGAHSDCSFGWESWSSSTPLQPSRKAQSSVETSPQQPPWHRAAST